MTSRCRPAAACKDPGSRPWHACREIPRVAKIPCSAATAVAGLRNSTPETTCTAPLRPRSTGPRPRPGRRAASGLDRAGQDFAVRRAASCATPVSRVLGFALGSGLVIVGRGTGLIGTELEVQSRVVILGGALDHFQISVSHPLRGID